REAAGAEGRVLARERAVAIRAREHDDRERLRGRGARVVLIFRDPREELLACARRRSDRRARRPLEREPRGPLHAPPRLAGGGVALDGRPVGFVEHVELPEDDEGGDLGTRVVHGRPSFLGASVASARASSPAAAWRRLRSVRSVTAELWASSSSLSPSPCR